MPATTPSTPPIAPPAPAPAPAAAATPALPMPTSGGAWLRNPDGSLTRDPTEHPAQAATTQE